MDSAKVAELKAIWTAKAEQCYYRAQFLRNFAMPIAGNPSPDFMYIKDAIMYAIKPYTNIRALGIQDMGIAIAYNRKAFERLIAREWEPCENIAQMLRYSILDPSVVGDRFPIDLFQLSFWRAVAFVEVSLMRILLYPLHYAPPLIRAVLHWTLQNNLSAQILLYLYGYEIPWPFLDLSLLYPILDEEAMRLYQLGIHRNGGKPVRTDEDLHEATDRVTWTTLDTEPIGCVHRSLGLGVLLGDDHRCDVCSKVQAVQINLCSGCDLKTCTDCMVGIQERLKREDLVRSRIWEELSVF
ncbi:MAG: hypothetical protein Q9204_006569 [Flavoplaca sp. TL-2023a]